MKLRIHSVDPETSSQVAELLDAAFEGEAESRLVAALRADETSWIPELSVGAFADDELVGYALLSRVTIGEASTPAVSFAPLAVDPKRQRLGVGSFLTAAVLAAARHNGEKVVVVLGHPEYYPRFGFVPAHERGIICPWNVPADAWMMLELDGHTAEGVSGVVTYPSAFYDAL